MIQCSVDFTYVHVFVCINPLIEFAECRYILKLKFAVEISIVCFTVSQIFLLGKLVGNEFAFKLKI